MRLSQVHYLRMRARDREQAADAMVRNDECSPDERRLSYTLAAQLDQARANVPGQA